MSITYTISDLARELDITTRAIRFYEDMGLLQPTRQGSGGRTRVYSPRDRYNTRVRLAMANILQRTFDARSIDYTTSVTDAELARIHFVVRVDPRTGVPDVDDAKLELARSHGAEVTVNAATEDPGPAIQEAIGGAHGVLVTAVHPKAFAQALAVTRRGATVVFNGLPPGAFPADIFDIVLRAITIRGSIVGTRQDMVEALDFYARGEIHPTVAVASIDDINDIFERMEHGKIDGRIVLDFAA